MSFEKFMPKEKKLTVTQPPQVKMLKGGQISLNATAYQEYLKGATHVELYYDQSAKKIGLQPKKYGTKATYKLRAVGKGKSTYRINAKPLIEHYDLKIGNKVKLTPAWNSSENLLELSM